jgi:glycosyltransferase involved in cell wall biosynthesis
MVAELHPRSGWLPRVVLLGTHRGPLRLRSEELPLAIAWAVDASRLDVASPLAGAPAVYAFTNDAIRRHGFELVHLFDPRLAPLGALMRRRLGVPVSVTLGPRDLRPRSPWAGVLLAAAGRLDEAFVPAWAVPSRLRLPVEAVPAGGPALVPEPDERLMASYARLMAGVGHDRLVVGLPWMRNALGLRWVRELLLPKLRPAALCLFAGVPDARFARRVLTAGPGGDDVRVHGRRLDAAGVAALARLVDAFLVPAQGLPFDAAERAELLLTLAATGLPVIAEDVATRPSFLEHERNAFLVRPHDPHALAEVTLRVLSLPASQRQLLGEEFALHTRRSLPWDAVAEVYAERFAALVGRPRIPEELRAAA